MKKQVNRQTKRKNIIEEIVIANIETNYSTYIHARRQY